MAMEKNSSKVFEAATKTGSLRASKWAPTQYVLADASFPFYGQSLSRPNPQEGTQVSAQTYQVKAHFEALDEPFLMSWQPKKPPRSYFPISISPA